MKMGMKRTFRRNQVGLQLAVIVLFSLVARTVADESRSHNSKTCSSKRDHNGGSSSSDNGFEQLSDENIQSAVDNWIRNRTGAALQYGPIEIWDTSSVTDMKDLFKEQMTFNDNIAFWDVSCVTTMHGMFWE